MSRPKNPVPTYQHHRPTGQAYVRLPDGAGGRRAVYLGAYDSPESKQEYERVIAEFRAAGGAAPPPSAGAARGLTVNEALLAYLRHIDAYYRDADGNPTGTAADIKPTLGYLRRLYGTLPLAEFGVPQFKAVRDAMVRDGRVRTQVNKRASQARQFVKWCVEGGLCPAAVLAGLQAVKPLAEGRGGVKSGREVVPADPEAVEQVVHYLSPALRAVVELLRLTGARPSEVLNMRPREVDRSASPWKLEPKKHKTAWRGKPRVVFLGPEAQRVLAPWLLGTAADAYVFSPSRSERERG